MPVSESSYTVTATLANYQNEEKENVKVTKPTAVVVNFTIYSTNIPEKFSIEWLRCRTLYLVAYGEGEDENCNEIDHDVPKVTKWVFGNDRTATITGLLNSCRSDTGRYSINQSGFFSMDCDPTSSSKIVCGSTSKYIKIHVFDNGEFDNSADLFFFNRNDAMSFASTLTSSIPPCNESEETSLIGVWKQITANGVDISAQNVLGIFSQTTLAFVHNGDCSETYTCTTANNRITVTCTMDQCDPHHHIGSIDTLDYTVTADTLTIMTGDEDTMVFTRLQNNNASLIGTWKLSTLNGENVSAENSQATYTQTTYTLSEGSSIETGTYTTTNNQITTTIVDDDDPDTEVGDTDTHLYIVTAETLTIIGNDTMVFTRLATNGNTMTNAALNGDYVITTLGINDVDWDCWSDYAELSFAGNGNALITAGDDITEPEPLTYSIASDGSMTAFIGNGIVSHNGEIFTICSSKTSEQEGSYENIVYAGIKKSSSMTNTVLNGDYVMTSLGINDETKDTWTHHFELSFAGNGNAQITKVDGVNESNPRTYSIASDGSMTAFDGKGIVSHDGEIFIICASKTSAEEGKFENIIYVGIKKSSSMTNAALNGDYIMTTLGTIDADDSWSDYAELSFSGNGNAQITAANGVNDSQSLTYSIASDGSMTTLDGNGIVSHDGEIFTVCSDDSTDGENIIYIGIKKPAN